MSIMMVLNLLAGCASVGCSIYLLRKGHKLMSFNMAFWAVVNLGALVAQIVAQIFTL